MNLNLLANGATQAVSPNVTLLVRQSAGYTVLDDGTQAPAYATPGTYVGGIAGVVLTITTASAGVLGLGQLVEGVDALPGTRIIGLGTGTGGVGTYLVDRSQTVNPGTGLTATLPLSGNVQPITWKDLQQLDGLNLQGTRQAIFFNGRVDGVIRPEIKGGDLVDDPRGRTYLVAQVLEQWGASTWCKVAATLQNGG